MEVVYTVLLYALGTFFGVDNSFIISDKTIITVNPQAKTITIIQENLFSIRKTEEDSMQITKELSTILANNWAEELRGFTTSLEFYTSEEGNFNSKIILDYEHIRAIEMLGFEYRNGKFAIRNKPRLNISSEDGEKGAYDWEFEPYKTFTFTLEPYKDIPERYLEYKKSIKPIYMALKEQ